MCFPWNNKKKKKWNEKKIWENNKWRINSEKQNSHSINNNFQLNSNFHNYFNSPLFLHFFKHSFSSKPYLPFPSSFNSNFHLFPFLIALVVYCYCYPILINITLLYQMNQCDWYAFFTHLKQTHWKQVLYSFKHVLWQLYTQNDISFQNHIHHLVLTIVWEKEKNQQQNNHVIWNNDAQVVKYQWLLLGNKWIKPPFFTYSTNSEIISF